MRIDTRLNLVIPVETDTGTIYVHSTPITREVFEKYFLVISKTFTEIYAGGLSIIAGPRIAMMLLRQTAKKMGELDGQEGVEQGLIAEIRRLTNVSVPSPQGWQSLPYDVAKARNMMNADDASEIENAIAFFTVASSVHRKADVKTYLNGAAALWGGELTSLNSTDYTASLPTSTPQEATTTTTSSVPS